MNAVVNAATMTKREWFAGQVVQGLASELIKFAGCGHELKIDYEFHAQTAVQMADALIAELAKAGKVDA